MEPSNVVEGTVIIQCPIHRVYSFYRDLANLPRFLGDVTAVTSTGPKTYLWTIQGPLGVQVRWTVRVVEERRNEFLRYETVGSPALQTSWEIYFCPGPRPGETQVREVMKPPLGRVGRAALALMGKFPAAEVSSNLHRLKQLMETGRVTDTSHAVKGKFDAA